MRVWWLVWVAAAGIALLALIWVLQRRFIYFPLAEDVPSAATTLPGAEDITFETADGLRLGGWFAPAQGTSNRATVLVFNGNAGDRSYRAPLAAALNRVGLSVLLFDYRGYGRNPGSPSESGLSADARAARGYLVGRSDVDANRLVYFGESLGAAVALGLAVAEEPPAALVLRSPFTSLADMGHLHYPFVPTGFLLQDRFDSLERVVRLACPLLVIAGDRDRIVPATQSRRLFEAAPEPKRFVLIPDADHNDLALLAGTRLIDEVTHFVAETPRRRPGDLP